MDISAIFLLRIQFRELSSEVPAKIGSYHNRKSVWKSERWSCLEADAFAWGRMPPGASQKHGRQMQIETSVLNVFDERWHIIKSLPKWNIAACPAH